MTFISNATLVTVAFHPHRRRRHDGAGRISFEVAFVPATCASCCCLPYGFPRFVAGVVQVHVHVQGQQVVQVLSDLPVPLADGEVGPRHGDDLRRPHSHGDDRQHQNGRHPEQRPRVGQDRVEHLLALVVVGRRSTDGGRLDGWILPSVGRKREERQARAVRTSICRKGGWRQGRSCSCSGRSTVGRQCRRLGRRTCTRYGSAGKSRSRCRRMGLEREERLH